MAGLLHFLKPSVPGLNPNDEFTDKFTTGLGYGCLVLVILTMLVHLKLVLTSKVSLESD